MAEVNERIAKLMDFADARGYFPARTTIEEPHKVRDASGETSTSWQPLASHEDLVSRLRPAAGTLEVKRGDGTIVTEAHLLNIKGYYPGITSSHRANVDGETFNILGVMHDGQRAYTKLTLERSA